MKKINFITFTLLAFCSTSVFAQTAHRSFYELPSANGFGSVHYSFKDGDHNIAAFYPHIYKKFSPDHEDTPNVAYDSYFGLRTGNAFWMNSITEDEVDYEPGTGIIKVDKTVATTNGDVQVTTYIFSPFTMDIPAYIMIYQVKGATNGGFAAFSLHNFHMGSGANNTDSETIAINGDGFVETGRTGYAMYYRPITAYDSYEIGGPGIPYNNMLNSNDYADNRTTVTENDLSIGFQFNNGAGVNAGESAW
jgi:hypothetical protein